MEVITIEETASKTIMEKLDLIADYIMQTKKNNTLEDDWLDNYAVCELLKISNRTLQRLRANNTIEHVKMGGKVYFQVKEIKRILQENIIHRNLNDFEQAIKIMEEEADDIMVKGLSKCLDKLQKIEEKIDALSKINQGLDGEKLLDNQDICMILKIDKKN